MSIDALKKTYGEDFETYKELKSGKLVKVPLREDEKGGPEWGRALRIVSALFLAP